MISNKGIFSHKKLAYSTCEIGPRPHVGISHEFQFLEILRETLLLQRNEIEGGHGPVSRFMRA